MKKLYPLKFAALPVEKRWGGEALASKFADYAREMAKSGEEIDLHHIGESFELYEEGSSDSSVVLNGFLAQNDIYSLIETYLGELVGDNIYEFFGNQFPLLIKFLDIEGRLSVQVHPDDETAAERYDCLGKSEFWYVVDAKPDAKIYMGFNRETTPSEFYEKCKNETAPELLNVFHPRRGECFYIEAGTVHAAEGGVVIAEIQENSNATLRLYDWGFENNPATRREMHLEEAIDCINYGRYDEARLHIAPEQAVGQVCDCRHFTINVLPLRKPCGVATDEYNSFILYMCLTGSASIDWPDGVETVSAGETVLIPASMDDFTIVPDEGGVILLEAHIKHIEEEEDEYIKK